MNNNFQSKGKGFNNKPATVNSFSEDRGQSKRGNREPNRNSSDRQNRDPGENEWIEKVVKIRRVTKVVKGGKNMSFSALVVVGDMKGSIGIGLGKAAEVVDAIRKAIEKAKKNLIKMPFDQGSIPHNITGHAGATKISLLKAPKGTGLIACWSLKMALESAGLHNVVCKTMGSTNPINVLDALVDGIKRLKTKNQIRQIRTASIAKTSIIHVEKT